MARYFMGESPTARFSQSRRQGEGQGRRREAGSEGSPIRNCGAMNKNEVIRLIAKLGGFLARQRDREPGVKTIWIGLQRVTDFAIGVKFLREVQAENCV